MFLFICVSFESKSNGNKFGVAQDEDGVDVTVIRHPLSYVCRIDGEIVNCVGTQWQQHRLITSTEHRKLINWNPIPYMVNLNVNMNWDWIVSAVAVVVGYRGRFSNEQSTIIFVEHMYDARRCARNMWNDIILRFGWARAEGVIRTTWQREYTIFTVVFAGFLSAPAVLDTTSISTETVSQKQLAFRICTKGTHRSIAIWMRKFWRMATDNVSDVGRARCADAWRINETNFISFDLVRYSVCEWENGVERNAERINGAISHANTSRDLFIYRNCANVDEWHILIKFHFNGTRLQRHSTIINFQTGRGIDVCNFRS